MKDLFSAENGRFFVILATFSTFPHVSVIYSYKEKKHGTVVLLLWYTYDTTPTPEALESTIQYGTGTVPYGTGTVWS